MIGGSEGVNTLIYQEQVSRQNQVQRDQVGSRESEENNSQQKISDVTSFSAEGLELARTAVAASGQTPEALLEQQPDAEHVVPAGQANTSLPAQLLDIKV